MINDLKYSFSKPGCGSLELELDTPSMQVWPSAFSDMPAFQTEGLDRDAGTGSNPIYFFEWQNIQYSYLQDVDGIYKPPFRLKINERIVNQSRLRNNVHLLSGHFSFRDEVGETKIEIRDALNKLIFRLETEVFPQKMDYRSDYKAMMEDISSIVQNLAFDSLKDTYRKSRPRISGHTTAHEWWNILDVLFDQLVLHLGTIRRQPAHEIKSVEKVLPVEKIRQVSKHNINWLRKNSGLLNKQGKGLKAGNTHYYTRALSAKKQLTYDTFENRFVAWAVKGLIGQLRNYHQHIDATGASADFADLLQRIKKYQGRLQGLLHENPFNEVSEFEKRAYFSTSLTRGAGYRDFMYVYLLLTRGLGITSNDIFKIGQKNISTLYEYWCFLMLVKLLKEQNQSSIAFQDIIKIKAGKYKVALSKGEASQVLFRKTGTNETTTIYFNREFKSDGVKIFTYNQRPDYSIEFNKSGFEKPFWYLFDAKYRFEADAKQNAAEPGKYNVPQEAIGQLHRYRDAILHTQPANATYKSAVKNLGGIILYPYPLPEEKFRNENTFYKSIAEVNIGAMPFLPGKTALVSGFLKQLINTSPEGHFEQSIEMDRSEYEQQRSLWKEWVTINVIPKELQEERVKFMREKKICHIPFVKDTHSRLFMTKKLLCCESGSVNAYLYDVLNWEIMDATALKNLGTTWEHKEEKYIVFTLGNERQISTPDKIAPAKFRYSTLEGLNRYLKDPAKDKNSFYLSNPDAARLYDELKDRGIAFSLQWGKDQNDPSLVEFTVGPHRLQSSDLFSDLTYKIGEEQYHLTAALQKLTQ